MIEERALPIHPATNDGTMPGNADTYAVASYRSGRKHAVAIVDGIGTRPADTRAARLAADVIAHAAVRHGARNAIMIANGLFADTAEEFTRPDMAASVVVLGDDGPPYLAHVGDTAVYAYIPPHPAVQGHPPHLIKLTVDQTRGQAIRANGGTEDDAAAHDHVLLNSVARTTMFGVQLADVPMEATLLLLCTDGVHRAIPHTQLLQLVHAHVDPSGDVSELPTELVTQAVELAKTRVKDEQRLYRLPATLVDYAVRRAKTESDDGEADNATAVILPTLLPIP